MACEPIALIRYRSAQFLSTFFYGKQGKSHRGIGHILIAVFTCVTLNFSCLREDIRQITCKGEDPEGELRFLISLQHLCPRIV